MTDRRTFLARAATLLAAGGSACSTGPVEAAAGQIVRMQIVERSSGEVLPEHRHRGALWVAGRLGDRYAVRMSNRSSGRVLVVLSVDGVNAITGQTAGTSQAGYVLAPWQSADIVGWRKSDAEVAAFYFTALPDSYAARTDRPQNVGVIGLAVFRESLPRPVPFEPPPAVSGRDEGNVGRLAERRAAEGAGSARQSSAQAAGAMPAPSAAPATAPATAPGTAPGTTADAAPGMRADRLGTGHGEREASPIRRTAFERATAQPAEIVQVRYDSLANLVAAGIVPASSRPWAPDPFPGYVPDPR